MKTSKYYHFSELAIFVFLFIALISCEKTDKKPYTIGPDIYIEDTGFKIVGYLGGGGVEKINNLELKKLTHLNLAFANPDKDGKLVFNRNADIKSACHFTDGTFRIQPNPKLIETSLKQTRNMLI